MTLTGFRDFSCQPIVSNVTFLWNYLRLFYFPQWFLFLLVAKISHSVTKMIRLDAFICIDFKHIISSNMEGMGYNLNNGKTTDQVSKNYIANIGDIVRI